MGLCLVIAQMNTPEGGRELEKKNYEFLRVTDCKWFRYMDHEEDRRKQIKIIRN